jgi:tetratricopeptide (TPR) repeat protein
MAELVSDNVTAPAEISYETPQACGTSPFHTLPGNPTVPTNVDGETETSRQYPRYIWDDEPKSFFDSIILDARRLESENEGFQALTKYRNALVGYRNLLPHTHPQLSSLEYELANLHMQLHQTKEAYELLNWMSKVHTRDLGPRHLKTVQHLNHVIGLLRVWSRQNDAQPLVQYLLQDQDSPSETVPYLTFSPTPSPEPTGSALTASPLVTDASLETFVLSLDERFKDRPVEISENALRAWTKLIRICVAQNDEARTKLAMTRAADSVRTVMQLKNSTWTMGLFRCVLDLMELFIKEGDFTTARETLEDVEAKLEGVLGNDYCNRLSILTGIALLYQNENRWSDAVAYLEHAQAVSARAYGRKGSRTRWIEDARRKGFYKPMPPVFPSL